MAVVNKPSGVVVHRGWARDRVVALTLARDALGQYVWPVHRLDRGTSGALVFALDAAAAAALQEGFQAHRVDKRYIALVRGIPPASGTIDHPIPRTHGGERVPAVTEYTRLAVFRDRYALVEARPRTGRQHQVRRHLKHISCPLIGDVKYGKGEHNRLFRSEFGLSRLALHALALAFDHPASGARLEVIAPLPADLSEPFSAMGLPLPTR